MPRSEHLTRAVLIAGAALTTLGSAVAFAGSPTLDGIIDEIGKNGQRVLAIERRGASHQYRVVTADGGFLTTQTYEVAHDAIRPLVGTSQSRRRAMPDRLSEALARNPASLAELVRTTTKMAEGFIAVEAEYEVTRRGLLAEVALAQRGTVIELTLDPFSGQILALELDDDDEDDDDGENDQEDDDELLEDDDRPQP